MNRLDNVTLLHVMAILRDGAIIFFIVLTIGANFFAWMRGRLQRVGARRTKR